MQSYTDSVQIEIQTLKVLYTHHALAALRAALCAEVLEQILAVLAEGPEVCRLATALRNMHQPKMFK